MEIYVDSEEEKQNSLKESKYIHDFRFECGKALIGLDSDKANGLMHIYMNPNLIIVRNGNEA